MNDSCFRNWSLTCLQFRFQLESQPGIIISGNYSSLRAARRTLCQVLPRAFSPQLSGVLADKEGLPGGTSGKEPACQCRRHKSRRFDPWVGKVPWRRAWQPLQYSCLENPTDRGAWRAAVHGVTKSQTRVKRLSTHTDRETDTQLGPLAPVPTRPPSRGPAMGKAI